MAEQRTIICISWQTEPLPVPAFCYFYSDCLEKHEFKSENIANGKRREVELKDMAVWARCDACGKLFVEAEAEATA